jgi:uncharacterized protein YndB with AHSA1/START domain
MVAAFGFDRTWHFPVPRQELWDAATAIERFPEWWRWLRVLDVHGADKGVAAGTTATCVIGPPLPYVLHLTIEVERLVVGTLVEARVTGDLEGTARLEVAADRAGGTTARLSWHLYVRRPLLQMLARTARPVLVWGHEWVVANGVAQFRERALGLAART